MKFFFTVHQFFPDFSAGTEVLTLSVAHELQSRGHEVRVLTGYPSPHPLCGDDRFDEYGHEGVHVYRFHHSHTPTQAQESGVGLSYDNQAAANYFDRILQAYQPDRVHFFHLNRLGTGLIERATQAGVPAFMSPTDFWAVCPAATLMLENGQTCSGPSVHAGNCVQHFAGRFRATRGSLASKVVGIVPVPLLDTVARWTVNGRLPAYPQSREVRSMALRLARNVERLNALQKIVVPTEVMRATLERAGVAPHRIAQLAYGIDAPDRQPRDYRNRAALPLRIGFIGTVAAHKGLHVLLSALKLLPQGAVKLAAYGNLHDFPDYAEGLLHSASGMANVAFRGRVSPRGNFARAGRFRCAGCAIALAENTPLVVHSALAAGCPVVGSDVPGVAALLTHGHNGLLFAAGNAPALATQLRWLVDQRDLLQTLSDQCQLVQTTASYVDAMMEHWNVTRAPQ